MRGTSDQEIDAQLTGVREGVEDAEGQGPPRPAGGKALLRLLNLLGSAGYEQAASAAIELAVEPGAHDEFRAQVSEFASIPGIEAPTPRRSRSRSQRKADGPGAVAATAEEVATAHMDAADQLGPPTAIGPQWRSLGPWTIPNGQTYGASRVNVSGRIAAIAVDPSTPAHVLVGAANGGIWESRDRGASWTPRTDYATTLAVGALAFDRTRPATVYGGLGEGNWWWWLGTGVLRSSDGGASWAQLCTAPFVGQGFYDLVVDPADGNHLLAGTTGGLYVSTDAGVSWTQRRSAPTYSISIAPAGGAKAEILAASSDGVWRSTNGGTSWAAVTLPSSPGSFNRLAVAIAPSSPGVAYAWGAGSTAFLWRRTSAGGGWTLQGNPPGVNIGQAWYDWFLAVSPDNANQIYCGAISVHRGTLSGTTWAWLDISTKPSGDSIHPDSHAIAFEPGNPNTIYVGNDGGLFQSPNRGVNWTHRNNGLVISEFEYLAHDYGSARWLIGGTQDNGTERWQGSPTWEHVADGDGGDCGVNRTNPSTVFHTYYGMSPERSTSRGNFGSWTSIFPSIPTGETQPFYPPFECSATNGDTIAIGGGRLYVSRNNGSAWTPIAYPSGGTATALYMPDRRHGLRRLGGRPHPPHDLDRFCLGRSQRAGDAARWGRGERHPRRPEHRLAHLGDLLDGRRRPGLPIRRHRCALDGLHDRVAAQPAHHGGRGRPVEREPRLGLRLARRLPDDERGHNLELIRGKPAELLRRRPALPPARTRAPRRHAKSRSLGDPGRRLDDRADLRSPVGREPCREPDEEVVHIQLARDLAHGVDGDADDRPARCATGALERRGRAGIGRVRHLLDYRPEPRRRAGRLRGPLLHSQSLLSREETRHVDRRPIHRIARRRSEQSMVHVQLASLMARRLVHDPDDREKRCAGARLGRRSRARRRHALHLLDHRQERGARPHHLRGTIRRPRLS